MTALQVRTDAAMVLAVRQGDGRGRDRSTGLYRDGRRSNSGQCNTFPWKVPLVYAENAMTALYGSEKAAMVLAVRQGGGAGMIDQQALHLLAAMADGTFEWISRCGTLDFHAPRVENAMTAL